MLIRRPILRINHQPTLLFEHLRSISDPRHCIVSLRSATSKEIRFRMAASSSSSNAPTAPESSEPIYFWKPEQEYGYLGQWFPSIFVSTSEDGTKTEYRNAEQYMMHQKGVLFAPDSPVTAEILEAELHPKTIKALGRGVPNFNEEVWKKNRYEIVVEGNYLKFTQNEDLKTQLLETGDRELVEASPLDRIWGVGFGAQKCRTFKDRKKWGLNLLGKALMDVRARIREEEQK